MHEVPLLFIMNEVPSLFLQVLHDMPSKNEKIALCELNDIQMQLYKSYITEYKIQNGRYFSGFFYRSSSSHAVAVKILERR